MDSAEYIVVTTKKIQSYSGAWRNNRRLPTRGRGRMLLGNKCKNYGKSTKVILPLFSGLLIQVTIVTQASQSVMYTYFRLFRLFMKWIRFSKII